MSRISIPEIMSIWVVLKERRMSRKKKKSITVESIFQLPPFKASGWKHNSNGIWKLLYVAHTIITKSHWVLYGELHDTRNLSFSFALTQFAICSRQAEQRFESVTLLYLVIFLAGVLCRRRSIEALEWALGFRSSSCTASGSESVFGSNRSTYIFVAIIPLN